MNIQSFTVNSLETNCFVVSCEEGSAAMVVDPGGEAEILIDYMDRAGLTPIAIVDTHGHIDHIEGNAALKERYPDAQLMVHADDADALTDPLKNLSVMMGMEHRSPEADVVMQEGDVVKVGECEFRVIHVPGHTPGGICLYAALPPGSDAPVLFAGDAIFAGSVGRGDFPGGDMDLLIRSIREKLLTLPDETVVFTGHGPSTSIGQEKEVNPFL